MYVPKITYNLIYVPKITYGKESIGLAYPERARSSLDSLGSLGIGNILKFREAMTVGRSTEPLHGSFSAPPALSIVQPKYSLHNPKIRSSPHFL